MVPPKPGVDGPRKWRIGGMLVGAVALVGAVLVVLSSSEPEARDEEVVESVVLPDRGGDPVELLDDEDDRRRALLLSAPPADPIRTLVVGDRGPEEDLGARYSERQLRAFADPVKVQKGRRAGGGSGGPQGGGASIEKQLERIAEEAQEMAAALGAEVGSGELGALPAGRDSSVAARFASASPYTLEQGSFITAQLVGEINSDLPGQTSAVVSSDVFSSVGAVHLLIPRGTRLIGRYESGLTTGQNRLRVAWDRMIFPDGRSLQVPGFPGAGRLGQTGLSDRVNHHTARILGKAVMLSAISAAFGAGQGSTDFARVSVGQRAVDGASRSLEEAAAGILERDGDIAPTIRIRAGSKIKILLTADLVFSQPYQA